MAFNGPYFVLGLDFEGLPPSEPMKRCLEAQHPMSLDKSPRSLHHIIENNVLMVFGMINYYDHFWDHPKFLHMVAADLEWDHDVCEAIVTRYERARHRFLKAPQGRYMPPKASDIAVRICHLIDNWRLRSIHNWPMTDERRRFIKTTRLEWRHIVETTPEQIIWHSPPRPLINPVDCDWMDPLAVQAAPYVRVEAEPRQRPRPPPARVLAGDRGRSRSPPAPISDSLHNRYRTRSPRRDVEDKGTPEQGQSNLHRGRENLKHKDGADIMSEVVRDDGPVGIEQDMTTLRIGQGLDRDQAPEEQKGPVTAALVKVTDEIKKMKPSDEYDNIVKLLEAATALAAMIDGRAGK
ncbi:hypothetical protein CONLIGDRAFT_644852 [Coniochaeta ligniaria NRRL 30616]|uniref:Uncharacterized protein n=1 Tax=Coniochaeta ligniaria NRRL 30616 TaxID=1408157 RepID=A0A1J7JLV9_9PEZI|nr:hypothetical protein CONLIGDRAFT_644852 [Coniochaeta ligniaria NRRL 30616]